MKKTQDDGLSIFYLNLSHHNCSDSVNLQHLRNYILRQDAQMVFLLETNEKSNQILNLEKDYAHHYFALPKDESPSSGCSVYSRIMFERYLEGETNQSNSDEQETVSEEKNGDNVKEEIEEVEEKEKKQNEEDERDVQVEDDDDYEINKVLNEMTNEEEIEEEKKDEKEEDKKKIRFNFDDEIFNLKFKGKEYSILLTHLEPCMKQEKSFFKNFTSYFFTSNSKREKKFKKVYEKFKEINDDVKIILGNFNEGEYGKTVKFLKNDEKYRDACRNKTTFVNNSGFGFNFTGSFDHVFIKKGSVKIERLRIKRGSKVAKLTKHYSVYLKFK